MLAQTIAGALAKTYANKANRKQIWYVTEGRKALEALGFSSNPVGVGNSKTELPGTYRPVGASCPSTCALLGSGCYAQKGRVNMVQVRAETDLVKDLCAAGIAMATAAQATLPGPARLHVSGDLLRQGALDLEYIAGLKALAQATNNPGSPVKAYGYTHAKGEEVKEVVASLKASGIFIRPSVDDKPTKGAAFVAEKNFTNFRELKMANPDVKLVKCREQVDGTSCAKCKLCWSPKTEDHCILFAKH